MARKLLTVLTLAAVGATPALADRMSACRKSGSPGQQIEACSEVISRSSDADALVRAWTYRGNAYARKGMTKEAVANYKQAIRMRPGHHPALTGRGMTYLAAKQMDQAIADFTIAISIKTSDASTYVARGYAYLAKGQPDRAIADFTQSLKLNPGNASAYNNRGLAYRKLGRNKRAVADYTRAVQINPLYALAYNNRGYVHEALGNKAKAIDDFRNALAIDPSLTGARDALVRLSAAQDIASLSSKRVSDGRDLAQQSCAWCHAVGRKGDSPNKDAPRFRDIHARHPVLSLRQPISRAIATPHDKMPKLPMSNAQIDQIIAYINSLRP